MNILLLPRPLFAHRDSPRDCDAVLVARARCGEGAAFGMLLDRHRERVLNLAFGMLGSRAEAEDAAQETFVRAYQALPNFRGEAAFGTWVYRIAVNICLARGRRSERSSALETCDPADEPEPRAGHDLAQTVEARAQVQQALAALSPVLRAALVLREMHGLSYQEIAQVLQIPVGTVRSRLSQARRLFRDAWEEGAKEQS